MLRIKHRAAGVKGQQLVAVKRGQGDEADMAVGAQQAVERIDKGADRALRAAAAVTGMAHGVEQPAAAQRAVLAHLPAAQKHAGRAEQAEVVQRLHRRDPGAARGPKHRRADRKQCVVYMYDVDTLAAQQRAQIAAGLQAEHRAKRQQQLGGQARRFVVALVHDHAVAVRFEQAALGGKNSVLAAGQAVMAVDKKDGTASVFHAFSSLPFVLSRAQAALSGAARTVSHIVYHIMRVFASNKKIACPARRQHRS